MSHFSSSDHAATASFTPQEVEAFRSDDKHAAGGVVGLMLGIFVLGLLGYLVVCYWVS